MHCFVLSTTSSIRSYTKKMNKLLFGTFFLFVACFSIQAQDTNATNRVENTIEQLHLDVLEETIDLEDALYKVFPDNLEETVVVIPEMVNEEDDVYELNSHIFIIDNKTGQVTHNYFESSKTNGWTSDAIFIDNIAIDTTAYKLTPTKNALGIIVTWRSMSRPNPYRQESLSLYTKEKDSLKKVLDLYTIFESSGEVNVNVCHAKFNKTVRKIHVTNLLSNNYFKLLVNEITSEEVFLKDENGECKPKEKIISRNKEVLKFDNDAYSKKEFFPRNPQFNQATIDSISLKEIKRYIEDELPTIYDYYKKETIDPVAIWSDKLFGRCCTEADLNYSELLEFKITANTNNIKYPSTNLSDNTYSTAYVFKENQDAGIVVKLNRDEEAHEYHTKLRIDDVLKVNDTLLSPFRLSLVNGYVKSEKTFKENGRVKELKAFLNNTYQGTVELQDTPLIQEFELNFSFFKNDEVTLIPISFYKGTKYDDICISEIQSSLSQITSPHINKNFKISELLQRKIKD